MRHFFVKFFNHFHFSIACIVAVCLVFSLSLHAAESVTIPLAPKPKIVTINKNFVDTSDDRLTFNFQNIEVRSLLSLLAKAANKNFIISDSVKGTASLNLKKVTWDDALTVILKSYGLSQRKIGNTLYISTTDEIFETESKELQSEQQIANLAPLKSVMINLKYTDAGNMAKLLKGENGSLLTPRGEIAIDSRTNSIIIRDIATNLTDIVVAIRRLDIPAKQVSIEARIVTINTSYEEQIGVRFGVSNTTSLSGTLNGANQLANGTAVSAITPLDQRLNFNLPAASLAGGVTPASIGLALARLGPVLLDMELSALEEEGESQVIARPRVVTSNQEKAVIQTGEEIPYQEASSSGATSVQFKKAVLSLEIVPQITPDNRILLRLKATQDTRGDQLLVTPASTSGGVTTPATFGPPTINTQAVESYVLLNNNETVVVGGVYKIEKTRTYDRVPFFSSLPIVGNLFKHNGTKDKKTELLIFLTPKIIESSVQVANNTVVRQEGIYKDEPRV